MLEVVTSNSYVCCMKTSSITKLVPLKWHQLHMNFTM